MGNNVNKIIVAICGLVFALSGSVSQALVFDLSWEGAAGYSMSGQFSYDDSLINTGSIGARDLDTFSIEVFQNGESISTWDLILDGISNTAFNFNFNTDAEMFNLGGSIFSSHGQYWNMASTTCNGAGFRSSETIQIVCADGVWRPESLTAVNSNSLQAVRHELTTVPVPPSIVLFLSGCLSLYGFRWIAKY